MYHKKRLLGIACIALIGFSIIACDAVGLGGGGSGNGGTGGGGNINITGDWEGTISGYTATVTLTANRWTLSLPYDEYETGTYTRRGNTITLFLFHYDYGEDVEIGTGVILDNNTIRATINSLVEYSGTYTFYRAGSRGTTGGNNTGDGGNDSGNGGNDTGSNGTDSGDSGSQGGNDTGNNGGGTSTVLSAPASVSAKETSPGKITVSWSAVSGSEEYYVYRASSASGYYSLVTITSSTSYTDTYLSANTTYYYKVSAYDWGTYKESPLSSYVSVTTSPESSGDNANTGFGYRDVSGGVEITGYFGPAKDIHIPTTIDGKAVVSIKEFAFQEDQLTGVTIPNSVTSIGGSAFSLNQLTSVTIPNSVTTIGSFAFWSNQLTGVTIPNSVTTIKDGAFDDNPLTSVTIGTNVGLGKDVFNSYNSFESVYEAHGKSAGTYTRSDSDSSDWVKR